MKDTIWSNRGGVFHTLRDGETMQDIEKRCVELRDYTPRSYPLWVIDDEPAPPELQFLPLRIFVDSLEA